MPEYDVDYRCSTAYTQSSSILPNEIAKMFNVTDEDNEEKAPQKDGK